MEAQEVILGVRDFGGVASSSTDGLERQVSFRGSENLGVDILDDWDAYWEDIIGRLTVSRMVGDAVIKGMVKAVEQDAAEKIETKELEVASLREMIQLHQLGTDKSESSGALVENDELGSKEKGLCHSFPDALMEHDKMRESLSGLRSAARGQIQRLKKEIECIRGCSPMRRINSGSELVGLGGILQEKASESLVGVDKTLDNLKKMVDAMCMQVDDIVRLAKASLCEWQQEQEFQRELEATVTQCLIRSVHEEFEEKLWDQSMNWVEKMNEVSNLRNELDAIIKSLPHLEAGQQVSHGSRDVDYLHRKVLSNHFSPSSSHWEGNGIFEESTNGMPENWEAAALKHMTRGELVNHFNTTITKMRRNHESKVQVMTEEYFRLKGEYLKEKDTVASRKDNDFDILRKKIPDVILKLDNILMKSEKQGVLSNNSDALGDLKDRLTNLLLQNRQLRDSLLDKRKEVKCLSSQVSDAAEKMLQHSLTEGNLLKLIENLKSSEADALIEASVTEDVYRCVLKEVTSLINCKSEEFEMQAQCAEFMGKYEIEDSDINYLFMQGLRGDIFMEVMKDVQLEINELNARYLHENKQRIFFEMKALEKEEQSRLVIEEKERLKLEVQSLVATKEEKEKLVLELSAALTKEKEQFEFVSQEINNLKDQATSLQRLEVERSKELDSVRGKFTEALPQIDNDKVEISQLNQNLEIVRKQLRDAYEERNTLLAAAQERDNDTRLFEMKETEQKKQMQEVTVLVCDLLKGLSGFESQVAENIKRSNARLEESNSQLSSLIQRTNVLKRTVLLYKRRLEGRCNDLQMAEAEVDLLGDEVDALLSLLEKIYIALDHYSPILQHYPGIMEILKLVKRELSGESTKAV